MQVRRSKIIIRTVVMLTAVLSVWLLAILINWSYRWIINDTDSPKFYRELGVYGLLAIIPLMSLRACIQAWCFVSKGIVSIYSGWLLFGFMAGFAYLFHFFEDQNLKDGIGSIVSICAVLVGILMVRQNKFLAANELHK